MNRGPLHYANVMLMPATINKLLLLPSEDADIKYDFFDYVISNNIDSATIAYMIHNPTSVIGYVALYCYDSINRTANIYGRITNRTYYGDFVKAFIALLKYAFIELRLNKLTFCYRQDNYIFDEICENLHFIREGLLRGQLYFQDKSYDINLYGMLNYEYQRLASSWYKRMFSWDYDFSPRDVVQLSLTALFNRRLFTNSLDNPNRAQTNDWIGEFALNRTIINDNCLEYKNIKFPVRIFDQDFEFDCFSCAKQEISVNEGQYSDLLIIATAQFGDKQTHITAEYSDGSVEEMVFTVGDWCAKIARDEYVIHYAAACRQLSWNTNMIKGDAHVYLQRVRLNGEKTLCKLIFPNEHDIFIFAGGLCS